jgi:hypothetical protein
MTLHDAVSPAEYPAIVAASDEFLAYLVERYRSRMDEPMPNPGRAILALACCRDETGWQVCIPATLGDDVVIEYVDLPTEGVRTRGDLIRYMQSEEWKSFMRWMAEVDEDGNPLTDEAAA